MFFPRTICDCCQSFVGSVKWAAPLGWTTILALGRFLMRVPAPPPWSRWMCEMATYLTSFVLTRSLSSAVRRVGMEEVGPVSMIAVLSPLKM